MNVTLHQVMVNFGEDLASCIWHVWWPGTGDPFYQHNPAPVHTRIGYYGINAAPTAVIDGVPEFVPYPYNYTAVVNYINNRLTIPSPMTIDCSGSVVGTDASLAIDVTVETPQAAGDWRLFVALIEDYIEWPGQNGEQEHYYVFRWANNGNNATGEPIDLSSAGLQQFNYTMPFYEGVYQVDQMGVTAWIQNYSTREILQAGHGLVPIPYYVVAYHDGPAAKIGGPGDLVQFAGDVQNAGANDDTYDVTVSGVPAGWNYSYTTPAGTYSGPSTLSLGVGESAPVTVELDSQGAPGSGTAVMRFTSQAQPSSYAELDFQKMNGLQVLLVDDDGGQEREDYVEASLTAAGADWGTYHLTDGELTAADLQNAASSVFWMCGTSSPSLTPNDRAALGTFMDAGGNACVSGSDVSYDLADPSSINYTPASEQWYTDYLHAVHVTNFAFSWTIDGTVGDPIGDGFDDVMLASTGDLVQLTPDGIAPGTNADLVFTYVGTIANGDAGVRWEGGSTKVVFLSFGIEGFVEDANRDLTVARILDWFEPSTGIGAPQATAPLVRLAQNVPNPFRPSTSIRYELGSAGPVHLRIYDVNGRLVRTLVDGTQQAAPHTIQWSGDDDAGRAVASGIYFYQLEAPGVRETRRMVLSR